VPTIVVLLNIEYYLFYQFPPSKGITISNIETSLYSNVNINLDLSKD